MAENQTQNAERDASEAFKTLAAHRGSSLVSTADCGWLEINKARRDGRLFVTEDGFGFVLRLPNPENTFPASGAQKVSQIDEHPSFLKPDAGRSLIEDRFAFSTFLGYQTPGVTQFKECMSPDGRLKVA